MLTLSFFNYGLQEIKGSKNSLISTYFLFMNLVRRVLIWHKHLVYETSQLLILPVKFNFSIYIPSKILPMREEILFLLLLAQRMM